MLVASLAHLQVHDKPLLELKLHEIIRVAAAVEVLVAAVGCVRVAVAVVCEVVKGLY
jgi:hypothetical protein